MATTLNKKHSHPLAITVRRWWTLVRFSVFALTFLVRCPVSLAQVAELHRTLSIRGTDPLLLDVNISSGDLQIIYGRDGQVSISAVARASSETKLADDFFSAVLAIDQEGNHLTIHQVPRSSDRYKGISVSYRIDVPYRTEVISELKRGKQNISGILGPVKVMAGDGDIKASYISKGLQARAENGNLDLQVIGEHVEAKTANGNISCVRVAQGVSAETGSGDISFLVVGPSTATVTRGTGRVDVQGARGSLTGSTDQGDLHVKAIPRDDWHLASGSGTVHVELPAVTNVMLNASTTSGELQVDRDDMARPDPDAHLFRHEAIGGGKRIEVHTASGRIVVR